MNGESTERVVWRLEWKPIHGEGRWVPYSNYDYPTEAEAREDLLIGRRCCVFPIRLVKRTICDVVADQLV